MDPFLIVQTFLFIGFAGIAIGSGVNYRRMTTGMPLSPLATATQVVSIGFVLLTVGVTFLAVVVQTGYWPYVLAVSIVVAAGSGLFIAGSAYGMRRSSH
jgi:hypothetical protein